MQYLKGIVSFVEAARLGSFTKAAARLEVSPQAISSAVQRLEESIGARLFNRTTRSLSLTEEGDRFLIEAQRALDQLDRALSTVTQNKEPSGLVRVTCAGAFGRQFLLGMLPSFQQSYPKVCVEVSTDDRRIDIVREGFDAAIRGAIAPDSGLVHRRIAVIRPVIVASPQYLERHGVPQQPEDLHKHHIIQVKFLSGRSLPWTFKGKQAAFQMELEPSTVVSDPEIAKLAAIEGLGVAITYTFDAEADLREGRLVPLLTDHQAMENRELVIQYPHSEHIAPRVKAFVDHVVECSARIPAFNQA